MPFRSSLSWAHSLNLSQRFPWQQDEQRRSGSASCWRFRTFWFLLLRASTFPQLHPPSAVLTSTPASRRPAVCASPGFLLKQDVGFCSRHVSDPRWGIKASPTRQLILQLTLEGLNRSRRFIFRSSGLFFWSTSCFCSSWTSTSGVRRVLFFDPVRFRWRDLQLSWSVQPELIRTSSNVPRFWSIWELWLFFSLFSHLIL